MKKASLLAILVSGLIVIILNSARAQNMPVTSLPFNGRTYTTTADFHEGNLLSVNTDVPDQLQLDQPGRPLPYINIACSERGTVVRIDIETGAIVGEYRTCPSGRSANPSRTTVDKYGNVWVTNRDEAGTSGGLSKGSVTRIGITIGGTRCDSDGTPNATGQYLKPPFFYNTCIDRNGDGLIKTSNSLGNILPWSNPGGVDDNGGVTSADDEAIVNYTRVRATGARTVAIDEFNDLWVGGSANRWHEKLNGNSGQPIPGTQFNVGHGGYGGFIDDNGILWSSGSADNSGLLRYDTENGTYTNITGMGNYGLGVDPNTGEIWHTFIDGGICKISPSGTLIGTYSHGHPKAQGCAVDAVGNVWVAHSIVDPPATTVGHIRTDGTFIGNVSLPQGGAGPTGVAVDANGKIWVACYSSHQAMRIDPNLGPVVNGFHVGEVDLVVNLGAGASPYNYSDMTGYVVINATVPSGTWSVIHDGGVPGLKWGKISWTDSIPLGTGIRVEARASDNILTLPSFPFVEIQRDSSFCCAGVTGRYVEIRCVLFRQVTVNTTPILYDLSIQSCELYPNTPPTISCSRGCTLDTVKVAAGQTLTMTVSGQDVDGDQQVTLSGEGLPAGSSMNPVFPAIGNPVQSVFTWQTDVSQIGVYNLSFIANDRYCYSATCPKVVSVVPCPSIQCSGAGISCLDSCNGRATVSVFGDPVNYSFTWNTNPAQTTKSIQGLCPGTYKVITYDGAACLDSCTVTIPSQPCTGFRAFTQGGWGATPKGKNVANYMKSKFSSVFPTGVTIGCNNKLRLTSWQAVVDFLPSGSTARALPAGTLVNPGSGYSNVLAGQLVAATLNVKFDSADANFSSNPILLKDLVIASGIFGGWTVGALIDEANRAIGGCGSVYSFSDLNNALDRFNNNYEYNWYMNSPMINKCYLSCPIGATSGSLKVNPAVSSMPDFFEEEFSVYPNPTSSQFTVRYLASENGNFKTELISNTGSKIRDLFVFQSHKGERVERAFSAFNLTPGLYIIRLTNMNGEIMNQTRLVIIR